MKKALFLCAYLFLLSISQGFGQNQKVSGQVIGQDTKAPLAGVSVTVKGTKTATVTDNAGNYSLTIPGSTAVLIFTYSGMNPVEKTVSAAETVNISMATNATALEEVVVNVGYGTQKKSVNTGAISSIRARDLEKVPNGRVEQALQGRVSGVTIAANAGQPGANSTIRVRGVTTFGGGNDPLWVIDGVVVDAGAIGYLNQSDIESIEVLKDATSAAIYGTRAATGVILITTKKGKAGKISISYNGFYGTSAPAKRLDLLNATQYATLMNEKATAGGGNVLFPDISKLGKGTDWQKQIFSNDALRYSHELSVSGGNERSLFYLSFGIQDQEGIVSKEISNYAKKSFRINSTHKISKIFTFGQTLGYTHQKSVGLGNTNSEFGGPLSSAINLDPTTPVVETDPGLANGAPYNSNPVIRDANGNPYGISSLVGQEMTNPKAYLLTRLGGYNWSDDIIGNAFLEVAVNKHIKLKSSVGGKLAYWGGQGFTPVFYLSPTVSVQKNNFGKSTNNTFNWNIENTLLYSRTMGNHDFSILFGQGAYVDNNGGGSSVTLFDLPISNYQDASFNFDISQANRTSGSYDFTNHKLSSLFSRVNYNYNEKYLFTGIIRRDGSSRFGLNNKYGTFPSFSLGWIASKEDFWSIKQYVKYLKIRGGYGKVGNDNISDFGYLSRVAGGFNYSLGNAGVITTGYSPTSLDNPDLKWEETSQANFGLEAQLFRNFTLTMDVYKKKTTGILRPVPIPGYVGVSESPVANIANMENSGFELELGYQKTFGQFTFSANANMATLKNKVTYVNSDTNYIQGEAAFQSMGPVTRTKVGESYNSFFGYQTAGIFQNEAEIAAYTNKANGLIQPNARPGDFRWVDVDGDGEITGKDKTFLGSNIPKLTFGITINVGYKGFDLMVFGQGATGNKIFQGLRRLDIINSNYQTKALSRWTGEGTSTDYPRLTNDDKNGNFGNMSDFYLEKGDYFRLKIVQLGYTYSNNFLKKIGLTRLRVYVTGENLATMTKYTGYDPEIGGGVFGIDKGYYPQARSFIAGVQVQF
ncbi:MAG TPA: TonB-dependent receptor [Ferruginibacter sp.]|nr:TonB-dependent receptor [Ferruginibacter sp.]